MSGGPAGFFGLIVAICALIVIMGKLIEQWSDDKTEKMRHEYSIGREDGIRESSAEKSAYRDKLDGLVAQYREQLSEAVNAVAAAHIERDRAIAERDELTAERYCLIEQNFRLAKRMDDAEIANRNLSAQCDQLSTDNARLTEANAQLIAQRSALIDRSSLMPIWTAFAGLQDAVRAVKDSCGPTGDVGGGIGVDVDVIREHLASEGDEIEEDEDDDDDDLDDDEICPICGDDWVYCDCDDCEESESDNSGDIH